MGGPPRILFFTGATGTADVWVIDSDGSDERILIGGPSNDYWGVFSPDGDRIAFDRTQGDPDLIGFVVAASDGTGEVALEHPTLFGLPPVWAPDGTMLLGYLADPAMGLSNALLVVALDGEAAAWQIPAAGNVGLASWQRVH